MLHAPAYRERFANDLSKGLPRIPFASQFARFAEAGSALASLHLGYETCPEHPLEEIFTGEEGPHPEHYRLTRRKMKLEEEGAALRINSHITLRGIPEAAHGYVVNGRSPLGWFIDRYYIKTDKHSDIRNNPNGWFEKPQDIIPAIKRIVHVSVETVSIVNSLPDPVLPES